MDKLRLRFQKTGRAVYISHLDLMHTMQRAFSRAGYALKYSEGFNPHPQISIALPLSVGVASLGEIMDFRLNSEADLSALPEKLTAVMPEGICVTDCYEQANKVSALRFLAVEGEFEYDNRPLTAMAEQLERFYAAESIVISKRTKRGTGESNIRSAIRQISFSADEENVRVQAVISAQEPTLNPALLAEAVHQLCPEIAPDFARYTRIENYLENMEVFR